MDVTTLLLLRSTKHGTLPLSGSTPSRCQLNIGGCLYLVLTHGKISKGVSFPVLCTV